MDNAFRWAGEKKLLRVNSVHGEEEAFLVLSETFELLDETGQTTELNGSIEVEAGCACILLASITNKSMGGIYAACRMSRGSFSPRTCHLSLLPIKSSFRTWGPRLPPAAVQP